MQDLCCYTSFYLVDMSGGYSLVVVHKLLMAVASLVAERGLSGAQALVVVACGLSNRGSRLSGCGTGTWLLHACGIFLDRGSNPCLLHWQANSLPLSHQGSPHSLI